MKKLLSLLFVLACSISMYAIDVVFVAGETVGKNTSAQGADEMTLSGVTVATTNGGLNAGNAYRLAKNSVTTISSSSTITKIVMECVGMVGTSNYGADGFTVIDGMTVADQVVTWAGSANSVDFTASGHQVRVSKITVTITGEATSVQAPKFSVAEGTFYMPFELELTGETGSTIYYTLDGKDPTIANAVYAAPIAISETTTVKAFAVKGELQSEVVTATYTKGEAQTVANIAAFKALDEGTVAMINNKLNVFYVQGDNVYAKDATGYICLYTKSKNADVKAYKAGDVIPAGIGGTKTVYRDYILEMADDFFNVQPATETAVVEPEVVGADFVTVDNVLHYIKIENCNVAAQETASYYTVTDANGATCTAYGSANYVKEGDWDYITALITVYSGKPQLTIIDQYKEIPPTEIANIAALPAEADGVTYKITGDVTVVAQSGPQLYITDESGDMLVYGSLGKEYNNGDVLTGIAGTISIHNGLVELVPVVDSFGDAVAGPAVEPEVLPIEEISQDLMHHFVKIEAVSMTGPTDGEKNRTFVMADETGELQMYINGFGVTAPTDLEGKTFDVTGFVAIYTKNNVSTLQLYPCEIKDLSEQQGIKGDLNNDGQVNAGDVSELYTLILAGEFSQVADLNNDGQVNAGDVSELYSIILAGGAN